MDLLTKVQQQADQLIQVDRIPQNATDRVSDATRDLLKGSYCVDVHTHFFDKNCVNSSYMILRRIKDFLGLRGDTDAMENDLVEKAYETAHVYTDDWSDKLANLMDQKEGRRDGKLSVLSIILKKSSIRQVYDYYINESSLAEYFNLNKSQVLTTALMMDFKKGWNLDVGRSMTEQIYDLKALAKVKPVLPFLFCDPRREEFTNEDNLYQAFNNAFANYDSFFGVKLYPCLGYDPADYRLWPIYKICQEKNIPVLSHCGGETVSTPKTSIKIFQGTEEKIVSGANRKEVAYKLNDPKRWEPVMREFPNLRLNIAHFGSRKTWSSTTRVADDIDPQHRKETIMDLMKNYPHVYSDFSYTIAYEDASKNLISLLREDKELLQQRTMFGSDFWVVYKEGGLQKNQREFLDMVGDQTLINLLCKINPIKYLFGTETPF